jgi:hypothetical protein
VAVPSSRPRGRPPGKSTKTKDQPDRLYTYDAKDKKLWPNVTENKPEVKFSTITLYKNNNWEYVGTMCMQCKNVYLEEQVIRRHKDVCKSINTISNEKQDMHIRKVVIEDQTWFRFESSGKLYKRLEDAMKDLRNRE